MLYLVLWYLGPMNQVPALDYLGATDQAVAGGLPLVYLAVTAALIALAFAGRRRRLYV